MTATAMGDHARNLSALLPPVPLFAFPKAGKKRQAPDQLTFTSTHTGLIAYQGETPVAWIYPGYHRGTIDRNTNTCHFVDVAYHRRTPHGVNLETFDCATLQEAFAFVRETFTPHHDAAGITASVNCAGHSSNGGTAA